MLKLNKTSVNQFLDSHAKKALNSLRKLTTNMSDLIQVFDHYLGCICFTCHLPYVTCHATCLRNVRWLWMLTGLTWGSQASGKGSDQLLGTSYLILGDSIRFFKAAYRNSDKLKSATGKAGTLLLMGFQH